MATHPIRMEGHVTRSTPLPAPETRSTPSSGDWVVLKFGGTSVASPVGWQTIANACRTVLAEGRRPFVVCSALAGVSSRIDGLVDSAARGEATAEGVDAIAAAHDELASALEVPVPEAVTAMIAELREGLSGVAMVRDASPRVRARLLAMGEQMSTRLGHAWLVACGLAVEWRDARDILRSSDPAGTAPGPRYLSARAVAVDPEAASTLANTPAVLTQGFMAYDAAGDTVLLGRGGSDTSAAIFGAGLVANRVEIWTDVPGMFSANPSVAPQARLISHLGYDEAEVLSALGARVLHPGSVEPLRADGVPLCVKSTFHPDLPGTRVDADPGVPGVKAVSARKGLVLFRMERPSSWQPVGFLADVSGCFARHGLSIDLLSTSPNTILATVDPAAAAGAVLDALIADLAEVSSVSVQRPVASVSLVGTEVRSSIERVGAVMVAVGEAEPLMVCPGASDHHLTFVVAEGVAGPLVDRLHRALFERRTDDEGLGPAWNELPRQEASDDEAPPGRPSAK
jgi:bifunctional diaminopimelate decarboxylase / aspartate kinase